MAIRSNSNAYDSIVQSARGDDGASLMEDGIEDDPNLQRRRASVRSFIKNYVDITYNQLGTASRQQSEALLTGLNDITKDNIISWEQSLPIYERMIESGISLYREFEKQLNEARQSSPRAISDRSIQDWIARYKDPNVHYKQREYFVQKELPGRVTRWKKVAKQRTTLMKHPLFKELKPSQVRDLGKFKDEESFLNLHYEERKGLVAAVSAALHVGERSDGNEGEQIQKLHGKAKNMLEHAAQQGYIGREKVGVWLERIFKSNTSPDKIAEFLSSSGTKSLSGLIENWAEVRGRFDTIEKKRKDKGDPRSFHFVSTDKFLNWHYSKRLSYVQEAENRFTDIGKENPLLLAIRHELNAKDWDSAEYLIRKAQSGDLNEDDKRKVTSMSRYLAENRTHGHRNQKESLDSESANGELEELLSSLPAQLEPLYRKAIKAGKFHCLATLMYNRIWCWEHNHLDSEKEAKLKVKAPEQTEQYLQDGHGTDFENSDLTTHNTTESIRSFPDTHANAPTVIHIDSQSHDTLIAKMQRDDSERFRYWSTVLPEGLPYGMQAYVVKNVHHKIKKCLRSLNRSSDMVAPSSKQKIANRKQETANSTNDAFAPAMSF